MRNEIGVTKNHSFIGLPKTRLGMWSVGFVAAFILLFLTWLTYVTVTPMDRPTFFSDPLHAVLILSATACGISGALVGILAVLVRRERSWTILLSVLVGSYVLFWTVAEIIGSLIRSFVDDFLDTGDGPYLIRRA